jgi:Fic family protein
LADEAMQWVARQKASKSTDPEILAAEIMQRLVRAHVFKDGNGRASRAVGAWVLCRSGSYLILDPRLYCKVNVDQYYKALGAPGVDLTKTPSGPWRDYCGGMFLQCFQKVTVGNSTLS